MTSDSPPPFESVLIANRGEIAVRVIRACAELGVRSIAVYSEADADALHTRLADEAYELGPGPAAESYLAIPAILAVARRSAAAAVHPGYGFLAEQAPFAEACADAGLVFVGPSPATLRLAGDKAAARRLAAGAGVPTIPGYDGPEQDDGALAAEAARVGYPLLVKAAAGGGGRGMRVARRPDKLPAALAAARREALAAFGDDALILERLLSDVRHVEVQVLGDHQGALVHLGERDCSVQRRHQKVVEESPAPGLAPALRAALHDAALRVAGAAGYVNAGTCEFLVDGSGQFWFIEMNARLQVEHPVTEAVTGLDLVRAQLAIAAGRPLPWRQEAIRVDGHAIECRVYAEDPAHGDLPATGRLARIRPPAGPGLRHDVGYADGDVVPAYYDTMLGKLIAHGPDRATALARARDALARYEIVGLPTNRALLASILDRPAFVAGRATTELLSSPDGTRPGVPMPPEALAASVAWALESAAGDRAAANDGALGGRIGADWRIAGQGIVTFWAGADDAPLPTAVADREGARRWRIRIADDAFAVVVGGGPDGTVLVRPADGAGDRSMSEAEGSRARPHRFDLSCSGGDLVAANPAANGRYVVRRAPPPSAAPGADAASVGASSTLVAPLPSKIVAVHVGVGDVVTERQPLVTLEAMKIESTLVAPRGGTVAAIHGLAGDAVAAGQVLVELA